MACNTEPQTAQSDPPVVELLSPEDGARLGDGEDPVFEFSLIDGDGELDMQNFHWFSSRDGQLQGQNVSLGSTFTFTPDPPLSNGYHAVVLLVQDSAGQSDLAEVMVEISP